MTSNVIWMRGFDKEFRTETQTVGGGGKGGGGGATTVTNVSYHHNADVAVDLCVGPIDNSGVDWRGKVRRTFTVNEGILGATFIQRRI